MDKLKSLLYKDFLLLIRDKAGLALSFIMPVFLVIIMTLLQESTFRTLRESKIPVILLNKDNDSLGLRIERELVKSNVFEVTTKVRSKIPTEEELKEAVVQGKYQLGIIIPEKTTWRIRKSIIKNVTATFSGMKVLKPAKTDSLNILIYIDPITKKSFKNMLVSTLKENAAKIEADIIVREMSKEINKRMPQQNFDFRNIQTVKYTEEYAMNNQSRIIPNAVQHNVPAWTLFAMFFIVISLSGNILTERNEGSYFRLQVMPCPYYKYILSKVIVYSILCLMQFGIMMAMGVLFFPAIGMQTLEFGSHYVALFVVALTSALAATGYSIAIGSLSTSHLQATTFGAISVVILAAIGGIWVPVFLMPSFMRIISHISPLSWGLNGFYDIFIRDGNLVSVMPESITLTLFFILCISVSLIYNHLKSK